MSSKHIILIFLMSIVAIFFYFYIRKPTMIHALCVVKSKEDAIAVMHQSAAQLAAHKKQALAQAQQALQKILAVPDEQRTYQNTAQALDHLVSLSNAAIMVSTAITIELIEPQESIRKAAREAVLAIQNFFIDHISSNPELYKAIKTYADGNAKKENLTDEQKYFLTQTIRDFEHAGLNLPPEQLEQVKKLKKEIAEIGMQFEANIAQDKSTIQVTKDELAGCKPDFIESLKKADDGKYIVGVDTPSYLHVMENCTVSATRQKLWHAYNNRAYPLNKEILQKIIAKRHELAQLLGFKTYAALELDDQMVHNPERVQQFLDNLAPKARKKAAQEFQALTKQLPESVQLTADGKFNPWDITFLKNQYKKVAFNLDESKVAQYFSLQKTIDNLLLIYQKFFNLNFKQIPVSGLWHPDVQLIEVIDNLDSQTIGYLFLDLHPRANKYSHACESTVVPVTYDEDGNPNLGLAVVIANFPKPLADKPSLLKLRDVTTFFHEFGHAMHALLGRTKVASFAGTNVKRDFVELPSQMLEEWMWDREILKMVSLHYQTGDPLPDQLIDSILQSRTYDSGFFTLRQILQAKLSLDYYNVGKTVDLDAFYKALCQELAPYTHYNDDDHFYASFGHLKDYAAGYYGYLWSSVFAHDMFAQIKKEGLLNPIVGRRYVDTVIGKGGSKDPNDLLVDFLHREPNQEAFLHAMGFE